MDMSASPFAFSPLSSSLYTPKAFLSPSRSQLCSPKASLRSHSAPKLKLSHRSLDKLLAKAAHLESRVLHQPCNVAAYRKQWLSDNKDTIALDLRPTLIQSKRKTRINISRPLLFPAKEALFSEHSPALRVRKVPSRSLGLSVRRGYERKQSVGDIDKLLQACDRERSLQRQLVASIKQDLRQLRPI
jgi:hypothetical protein